MSLRVMPEGVMWGSTLNTAFSMKTISAAGALAHASAGARAAARLRLMERLRSQTPVGTRDWARYDLYQRQTLAQVFFHGGRVGSMGSRSSIS